jgi:TolA-binding protein
MDAARKAAPASDLQIALAAARLGFRDEAREALRRLQAQNPGSPLAQQLLENFPQNSRGWW